MPYSLFVLTLFSSHEGKIVEPMSDAIYKMEHTHVIE